MDDEIDLRDIFRVIWKRRLLIIGVFVVAVLVAGAISFVMAPVYRVSSIVAMGNFEGSVYTSQSSAKNIILSDQFLLEVFETLPNATTNEFRAFRGSVKVEPITDSDRLIEISVETTDRKKGRVAVENIISLYANRSEESYGRYEKILSDQLSATQERLVAMDIEINQTRRVLQDVQDSSDPSAVQAEIAFSRALDRLNDLEDRRSALVDRILDLQKQLDQLRHLEVVSPVGEPVDPIWPRKALIIGIAGMLGLMAGILAAFLREELGRPAE